MDINSNFWDANPEYKLVFDSEFIKMSDSSKIMWSIYLYCDPRAITSLDPDDSARLEHIKSRYYPEFDPEDAFIETQIELYKVYIPEPETAYNELLVQCRDLLKFYKNINIEEEEEEPGKKKKRTASQKMVLAKDKMDGLTKAQSLLDKVISKRKDLQASRASTDKKGLAGYTPSRLESGGLGRGSR